MNCKPNKLPLRTVLPLQTKCEKYSIQDLREIMKNINFSEAGTTPITVKNPEKRDSLKQVYMTELT